jgi:hypothetical protein
MKNMASLILAIVWIIIGIILVGILFSFLRGTSGIHIGTVGDRRETLVTDTVFDAVDINSIDVRVISERVDVSVWDDDGIGVTIYSNLPEDEAPKASVSGRTFSVIRRSGIHTINLFSWSGGSVEIKMPRSLMESGKLEVSLVSTSGSIKLYDCSARRLDISDTSGSIHVSSCSAASATAKNTSGSINFEDCTIEDIRINGVSGSIRFDGSCTDISAQTVSGSVKVETATMLTDGNLESVSGSVSLTLPDNEGFELEYNSISGRTRNQFTGLSASKNGRDRYGSGGPSLYLKSVSGSISVDQK